MLSATKLVTFFLILHLAETNFTRISRENALLSRKRRYLNFPMGSSFVITLSHIKSLLQVQPRGWAILLEADVPFALPTDTRKLKKAKIKRRATERENFLKQVEDVFTGVGLDGEMCTRKIVCTLLKNKEDKRKSLVQDLLLAAFVYPEADFGTHSKMCNANFTECSVPFLEYVIGNVFLQ